MDAEVTWDERIPDPDNPSQPRQIDITIKRDGKLTIVECRIHKSRQNVKWIEELIGRRASLNADSIIAVSSSGFTSGAIIKSKRFGIILRELAELSNFEVSNWGRSIKLTLIFYQYSDLDLSLFFYESSKAKLDKDRIIKELKSYAGYQSIFNSASEYLDSLNIQRPEYMDKPVNFGVLLKLEGFLLCGEEVVEVELKGKATTIARKISCPAVLAYADPETTSTNRDIVVERFELGESEIVHHSGRVSLLLDLTQLEIPPLCQFRFLKCDTDYENYWEKFELLGVDKLYVPIRGLSVNILLIPRSL